MVQEATLADREPDIGMHQVPPDIAKVLGEDIIFGRLAPATRLTEDNLIARFYATRHFVRQALAELERTGIVVREKNKGMTVRSLSPREVTHIYEVRELLQRQAALRIPLPAPTAVTEELERLHEEYASHLDAQNFSGVHDANDAFHLTMFAACGNTCLVESIKHCIWLSLRFGPREQWTMRMHWHPNAIRDLLSFMQFVLSFQTEGVYATRDHQGGFDWFRDSTR